MPSRYYRRNFIKGYYYHIYNRGANKARIFLDDQDYKTFIDILGYYLVFPKGKPMSLLSRFNKNIEPKNKVPNLVKNTFDLCEYCLMPNHFHLLVKQTESPLKNYDITNLMRRLTVTYAMYTKDKYDHSGTLLQGKFKNILVDSDLQLLQLSKYIHSNPLELQGSEPLQKYEYSSYRYYIGETYPPDWLNVSNILSLFSKQGPFQDYKNFVEEIPSKLDSIQNIVLE